MRAEQCWAVPCQENSTAVQLGSPEIGKLLGDVGEGGIVRHVPVEHVVFVHLHEVEVVLQHRLGNVVAARVQEDPAVRETRLQKYVVKTDDNR